MRHLLAVLAAPALLIATPALAHPKVVAASPAPDSAVASTATLRIGFSEPLIAGASTVTILMTDMPGMKMKSPMAMPHKVTPGADGKSLVVTLARPLPRGTYKVDWHAVSDDAHEADGSYGFKVR